MGAPGLPGSQFPSEDAQVRRLKDLERQVQQFAAANVLATAGISTADGGVMVNGFMEYYRADGTLGVRVDPATGTFTAYDATGINAVARFGELLETAPGQYGVEVLVDSTWVQLGAQSTTWTTIAGRPGIGGGATIDGSFITGTVPDATTATTAAQADGVTPAAFVRDVTGLVGSYKAAYMHSTGVLGYNTSDEKYKKNIRDLSLTPDQLLALRAVIYDRKATGADDYTPAVSVDELGMIAGEVAGVVPSLALRFDGEIDSVFYERIGVVLLPFVQAHERTINMQQEQIAALTAAVQALGGNI